MNDNMRSPDEALADAHNLPDELPGDALGGGFENGEGPQPPDDTDASLLADAHELPDNLPGDELGGGFENGESAYSPKRSGH
jgi:hypothetical protein